MMSETMARPNAEVPATHAIPLDTAAEAHAAQLEIYRRLGGRERLGIAFRLSDATRRLTMAGIRGRHPHYTDDEVRRAYARLVLGDALTQIIWPDHPPVAP
jgi:hypothetical protein